MQFQLVETGGIIADVCQAWHDLYADLYRETHEESASDAEILADAETRLQILTRPDPDDECEVCEDGNHDL